MCGRYVSPGLADIEREFAVVGSRSLPAIVRHFNVAPTTQVR